MRPCERLAEPAASSAATDGSGGPAEQSKYGGHDHCPFCNTRFSDRSEVDYDVDEGWVGFDENGYERWVCAGCFEKLHERFGWRSSETHGRRASRLGKADSS